MTNKPVIMFYVQHLLGIGHVFRATRIAGELAASGCQTHLVWGGTNVPNLQFSGLHLHKLTAVRSSDETFSQLVHADGRIFTNLDEQNRRDDLLALFKTIQPDILITEAYPFGRRQMRFELVPLTAAAKERNNRPLIVSSIRDIMQEGRKQIRVDESLDAIRNYYDLVLVHGDPALIPIEKTLQGADLIMDKVRYTGIVAPSPLPDSKNAVERPCNVLVSSGGGATGYPLLNLAMDAMLMSKRYPDTWRFVAGTEMPEDLFKTLMAKCPENATLERYVDNMVAAMSASKVSVSRAGYNTVGDVLRAGPAAILIPFTGGRETEQLRRAELMQERGVAVMLDETTLTAEQMARAIDAANKPSIPVQDLALNGAKEAASILLREFADFRR